MCFAIDDAGRDRGLDGRHHAPDRRHAGVVHPVGDVGHEHRVAVARVDRPVEPVRRRVRELVGGLRHLLVEVDDGRIRLALLVVGGQEERRLQLVALVARVVHELHAGRPRELRDLRPLSVSRTGFAERRVGDVVVGRLERRALAEDVGVGVLGLHQLRERRVGPREHLHAGLARLEPRDARLLRPLAVGREVLRLRQIDARRRDRRAARARSGAGSGSRPSCR